MKKNLPVIKIVAALLVTLIIGFWGMYSVIQIQSQGKGVTEQSVLLYRALGTGFSFMVAIAFYQFFKRSPK